MPQGLQTLVALLVLLPGFISSRIARSLSAQGQQSELERIVEGLIFSFINYVFYIALFGTSLPIEWIPEFQVHRWRIAFLALMACGIGSFWGFICSRDLVFAFLRKRGVTTRTSKDSVWNDVFSTLSGTAQVGFKDGRNLIGWIGRYSDSNGERSLFLERAYWVQRDPSGDQSLIGIPGKGIFLTEKAEIEYVMFLDDSVSIFESKEAS